ncbi:Ribbon-helix-helix [Nostoc flagelliforme CCNUN1]|uniref:Ribbon-helix-helix n=1 Tax=Nostoc flagelliforme CCNUN1 TaxID=2038116 RepID=A0A2K8T5D0_9NOSO|nr:Ribbon-helix-helix [Nostoc flagelliforme CCNUN1]
MVKNFPDPLRNRLRLEAMSREITMGELLTQIVEAWLEENGTVNVNNK